MEISFKAVLISLRFDIRYQRLGERLSETCGTQTRRETILRRIFFSGRVLQGVAFFSGSGVYPVPWHGTIETR